MVKPQEETDEKVEKQVKVDAKKLQQLLDQNEEFKARLARIEYAADKSHLAQFDSRNPKNSEKRALITKMNDKIVIGWKMTEDIVEKNPTTGAWMERQTIVLTYIDETTEEMPYQVFTRRHTKVGAVIKAKTEAGDQTLYTLVTDDGVELMLDSRLLN